MRYYDEIGLLKPAYCGENNYRYYEEEQLLMLQQILFYRELGMPLNEIQRIIHSDDFDKVEALQSHKKTLEQGLVHSKQMIKTINKTISYLRGSKKMKDKEFYYGFDSEKQKEHEKYLIENNIVSQELIDECNQKTKNWSVKEKNLFIHDINKIMDLLIAEVNKKSSPDADEVQNLMRRHYVWLERTWTPTKEKYLGLAELYQQPEFRKFYDSRHPKLLDFMLKAMRVFVELL